MAEITTYNFDNQVTGTTLEQLTFNVTQNSVAVDLTNAFIVWNFRKKNDLKFIALSMKTSNGLLTITDAANGAFIIEEQLINIPVGTYKHDLTITFPDGSIKSFASGEITIVENI